MFKWLVGAFLVIEAHFMASYVVPLTTSAKATFGGLLGWAWPWAYGDGGLPGQIQPGSFPIVALFIAVTAATLFLLAALSVVSIWVPHSWWRGLAATGAVLSLCVMVGFFGPTKLLPMAADLAVLWAALTNWAPVAFAH
jgi:hypothetical protein